MTRLRDSDRARELVAKLRASRFSASSRPDVAALCDRIRAFYYPKQGAFLTSKAKRRATLKTRRSGATTGGCRELLARALATPGFRAVYCNETREEARKLAWESDTKGGLVDLLRAYGVKLDIRGVERFDLAGIIVEVRDADLILEFSNGSQIEFFCADDERAQEKLRGRTKHVIWIDEAQKFRFLGNFYKAIVVGCLTDFKGECWLTGTPSRDCADHFYEVTRDDGDRQPGWEVHQLAVTDNPFFGATAEERWEATAGEAIRENGWQEDDPDLLREWFARWVKTDARFVYAANSVPEHKLTYAPARWRDDGFPDILAALADLPGRSEKREYFHAMGADLGTRASFAFVIWSWSLIDPILYELVSYRKPGLDYDEMAACLRAAREVLHIGLVVADAGGGGKPAVMGWSKKWVERYQLPIIEATKPNKPVAIGQVNNDIRHGMIKVRKGGPLYAEWKVHRWKVMKSETGGLVEEPSSRRDTSDAGLYAHRESYHHRARPEEVTPKVGTPEWALREESQLEEAVLSDQEDFTGYH